MLHYRVEQRDRDIFLVEDVYDSRFALKTESVFAQCNGYMGVRGAFDGKVIEGNRGMFVAGFFNRAGKEDVSELVNCPDVTNLHLELNGEAVWLDACEIVSFSRKLNTRIGELVIDVEVVTKRGQRLRVCTRRFASLDQLPLYCHRVEITVLEHGGTLCVTTGIDGQITNSGQSHFSANELRVFERKFLHTTGFLGDGRMLLVSSVCDADREASKVDFVLKPRSVYGRYRYELKAGETLCFEKFSYVTMGGEVSDDIAVLGESVHSGYESLRKKHREAFEAYWHYAEVGIDGATAEERGAVAFALYHVRGMTPFFTNKCSVGAKGLTGEGYKGHVFWDCEIFILPMLQHVFPKVAAQLLEFRYQGLDGAREKAKLYGYQGAMYPWEVAEDGREETPLYAALNIHTGKATKVWSGIKEHHVTADIGYAVWSYYLATRDVRFMSAYGYEMLLEMADFWCSRAVWEEGKRRFEIRDVIGPDEYTEHVDNNAYTNYMAKQCVMAALEAQKEGKWTVDPVQRKRYEDFIEGIYLPKPDETGVIPQDDTFLSKRVLSAQDIKRYQTSSIKQEILLDYSRDEVIDMQVLKQADVVMLMNLCPQYFTDEVIDKNVKFYESRTIHDSSLSLCAHAIACSNIGENEDAYDFFRKAMVIDLDENPGDSTDGIHAASIGGIWNCLVQGAAGLKFREGKLSLYPRLPKAWKELDFWLCVRGVYVRVIMDNSRIVLKPEEAVLRPIEIYLFDRLHQVEEEYEVRIR